MEEKRSIVGKRTTAQINRQFKEMIDQYYEKKPKEKTMREPMTHEMNTTEGEDEGRTGVT